ncbi:type VI secretion system lipoprotein TssJ [Noviherbaspirillum sp.]|jgi:type VI secretion system protein VasD|uniref:type VI secretion system lipoprotein TssJ n=1 Tax=Noviherbaspirillum sp. TaxID=1926288 RepID=UPI0025F1215B|nr:type VI secretion system lipoprotein TssJ [Noviherbaspirillum sp.]
MSEVMTRRSRVPRFTEGWLVANLTSGWTPAAITALVLLTGCGSATQLVAGKITEVALSSVGIKLPDSSAPSSKSKTIALRLEGARDMNAGDDGQGLATVIRLYKLRNQNGFLAMPYSSVGLADKEKEAIGNDLVEARELTLSPGQTLDIQEKLPGDAVYLAVAALFRSPYAQRWRYAFAASDAERSGITIGVHACAMTATSPSPFGVPANEAALLASARCK